MTAYQIPFDTSFPDQQLTVDLGDETFIFRMKWNTVAEQWYLSMYDQENSPIFEGIAFVLGLNYFELVTEQRFPTGLLYAFNYNNDTECGRDDLNVNVFLVYNDLVDA